MATVNAVVYDQFKREDGTFHVQIKIFHKDVRRFIETNHYLTARQLDANMKIKDKEVDFIVFCSQHIISLRKANRNGTADNHRAVRNSIIDYFKKKIVAIAEINSRMLFAKYKAGV